MIPKKPKPPLCRLLKEGASGDTCVKCHSSLEYKFRLFRKSIILGCIHPKCENYFKGKKEMKDFYSLTKLSYKDLANLINDIYDYQHEEIKIIGERSTPEQSEALNNVIMALAMKNDE